MSERCELAIILYMSPRQKTVETVRRVSHTTGPRQGLLTVGHRRQFPLVPLRHQTWRWRRGRLGRHPSDPEPVVRHPRTNADSDRRDNYHGIK